MNLPLFTGACTALVTPFLNGKVNYPMMEVLIRRQIQAGIRAIVVCGTTGEAPTLSDDEKIEIFRKCKDCAGHDCLIIAGTGSNSTEHAVWLSKEAKKCGVDALLIVSPYYNKATAEGLEAHYTAIAQEVHIPIILYNVPSRTGVDIPVSVYKRLSKIDHIIGVKEAVTDLAKIAQIRAECPDFTIWCGNDDLIVPFMSLGAKGVISVLSNIAPTETQILTQAALSGDFAAAAAMQCKLLPLIKLLFCEVNPIAVKAAMQCIGYDCGECRLPLTPLSKENRAKLQNLLKI